MDLPPIPNLRKQSQLGADQLQPQTHNFIQLPSAQEPVRHQKYYSLQQKSKLQFKSRRHRLFQIIFNQ
ncbi:hypothetical protein FGO68_gene1013 [Halteria grandinella]|uniref:Uncharacterized protein n=1 Tax=Halteria grandinella TaxID=5974 RepID=A0A8J8SXZ6_HALGN|nr:hypothetical protein FGO68_gene1013 [Halteria grandinella]